MDEKRIAVTGFAPFGAHAVNPSERVVRALAGEPDLATLVLPVEYASAGARLVAWLEALRPAALLLLGRHEGEAIRLERLALNLDDAPGSDEAGERRAGSRIQAAGPVGHWSTLPLDGFAEALARLGLPVAWSRDAGGFVCNHVFYVARHWVEQSSLPIPCGFLHLPPLETVVLARQLEGVRACLAALRPALSPSAAARARGGR